ncbi:MAG: EamA family transporter [Dehalococcoidia bacterium]
MSWADSAILAAAILSAVNVIDSHLIASRMPSLWAFLFPVGVIAVFYGVIVLVTAPWPEGVGSGPVLVAAGSGFIRGLAVFSFLYAMQKVQVSRIIPVVNIHPVIVAVLAVPLMNERLLGVEWLAIMITVGGAILISAGRDEQAGPTRLNKYVALPFIAALCLAGANLTSKYALEDISSWNMYAIGAVIWGLMAIVFSLRSGLFNQLRSVERPRSTFAILTINETLAPVAIVLLFWSIQRGPVSLVSTIASTQPVFVFIYALILGRIASGILLERRMDVRTVVMRSLAIGMIVGGVTIIHVV